jgi:hypothetical protein
MAKRGLQFLPQRGLTEVSPLGASIELGVGDILRLNRERRGLELQSVANQLRIRLAYLEAIEDGRYKDLPGSTYAVGFVRSYADYLELDGADIVRRFREEVARIHGRTRLIFPAITAEGTIPPAAILLLSIIGIGIGYGTWYYLSSADQSDIATVQEVPDRLINAPEAVVAPSAGSSQGGAAAEAPPASNTAPPAPATPEAAPTEPAAEPRTAGNQPSDGDGSTTGSTLSTIMAPEPLPSATDGGSSETDLVPPESATAETPAATAPESTPPAATAADGSAIAQPAAAPAVTAPDATAPAPTAVVPAAPAAAPAASGTPAVQPAPSTTAGADAAAPAAQPAPAMADGTTPPAPGTSATVTAPAAPAVSDTSQTGQTGSVIPSAPALPAAPEAEPSIIQEAAVPVTGTRIRINARLDTWIKITVRNGRSVINRVLIAGEGYDVPDEAGLKMITGNAGGMDILVDGAAIAPLGEPGKVRRDVELDPEKLKAGTAIPQ